MCVCVCVCVCVFVCVFGDDGHVRCTCELWTQSKMYHCVRWACHEVNFIFHQ